MIHADRNAPPKEPSAAAELRDLRERIAQLELKIGKVERQLASTKPLVEQAKGLGLWDFVPYGVSPDEAWVAVDRQKATALMRALARVDHWDPWGSVIEARPQP